MLPSKNEKEIEILKDEFYTWWFDKMKHSAQLPPSIFDWFLLKLKTNTRDGVIPNKIYMYTLRKVTGDNVEINISLGKSYTYVGKKESPKEFERALDEVFKRFNEEIIYAFVTDEDGRNVHPLYSTQKNYIMTESGKTFANVSHD